VDRRLSPLGGRPVREYQGVKMSRVELDRIVSAEILRDDDIRRRVAEGGRPLRSHATGISDDDLLAKLRGLGVDADLEKLAGLCDGALSAEEVVRDPAPWLHGYRSTGSRAHRGTAGGHLRQERPSRRGRRVPAAGGKGPAACRAAGDTRYGPAGTDRPGRRVACREAAPSRKDRAEPAVPMRKREEVQEVLRCPCVDMTG
jgi:hypothetical protein